MEPRVLRNFRRVHGIVQRQSYAAVSQQWHENPLSPEGGTVPYRETTRYSGGSAVCSCEMLPTIPTRMS
jgi:hypothetical protein